MEPRIAAKLTRQQELTLAWGAFTARQSAAATPPADDPKSGPSLNGARKPIGLSMAVSGPPTPFRLRKILVPVDFSAPSENALTYATGFAGEFGARLVLMHVISPITFSSPGPMPPPIRELESDLQRDAAEKLARWKKSAIKPETRQIPPPETYLCTGLAEVEIDRAAREMDADLIIMATRGSTGLAHYSLGSTTAHLVRHAPCPVLVVRGREQESVG